jgi:hypothetical protein
MMFPIGEVKKGPVRYRPAPFALDIIQTAPVVTAAID